MTLKKHSTSKVIATNRGFQYILPNGYKLSVMFGPGNYCENRYDPLDLEPQFRSTGYIECSNFEMAVFEPNGDMVDLIPAEEEGGFSDTVIGWVPASMLWLLISALNYWPVREEFKNEPETFEKKLRIRCEILCRLVKQEQDKAEKEAANEQA